MGIDVADDPVALFLHHLNEHAANARSLAYEISWVLTPGHVNYRGRVTAWVEGKGPPDLLPVSSLLDVLEAPASVRLALQSGDNPCGQGIGIALAGGRPSYRLYLHDQPAPFQKDNYQAWRWEKAPAADRYTYAFHYLSDSDPFTGGLRRTAPLLIPVCEAFITNDRFRRLSGYWVRRNPRGEIDQLDLAFPWYPPAGSLPGFDDLITAMRPGAEAIPRLEQFPVRHLAFRIGKGGAGSTPPQITLYTSAPAKGHRPVDEDSLQRFVLDSARRCNEELERSIFSRLPPLSSPPLSPPPASDEQHTAGAFYDGAIPLWAPLLGKRMHYHHGLFLPDQPRGDEAIFHPNQPPTDGAIFLPDQPPTDEAIFLPDQPPTDEAMDEALDKAVRTLYPFIPASARIYDIGCGWGGPLSMLTRELGCRGLGLTPSRLQFSYVRSIGLDVRLGDAEYLLPPGPFDCILLLESFAHIRDKERLLSMLRVFSSRLIMRVNCQDNAPESANFGDTMHMIASATLRRLLDRTGWKIRHWQDVRPQTLPSVKVWHRRLRTMPPTGDRHIETFRDWCSRLILDPETWGRNNPLIEVVADS